MIQTYEILRSQINLINNRFEGQVYIQKIYSTSYYLCLTLRMPGKNWFLYLGRGAGHEGIWLGEDKPEPFLRKQDTFLEYLRKHLSSTSLENITLDEKDRIVSINYAKWGRINTFRFFYLGRKLYFSNYFYDPDKKTSFLYKSWSKKADISNINSDDHFDEVGRKELPGKIKVDEVVCIDDLLKDELKIAKNDKISSKKGRFLKRKIHNIEADLERVRNWPSLFEIANSEADFSKYDKKCKISGVRINFGTKEHFHRRNEIFEKVKSLKKAEKILESRLDSTKGQTHKKINNQYENILEPIKPYWNSNLVKHKKPSDISKGKDYKIFQKDDFKMAIGLSAQGNDELRKNWANKDDIWFHLDGDKSSHIVIKLGELQLNEDIFTIVGSAMLEYSKLNYSQADLIYTQVKNLKGIPGVAGSVNYKKVKRVRVEKDLNWYNFFS